MSEQVKNKVSGTAFHEGAGREHSGLKLEGLIRSGPNIAVEPTPNSFRSYVAPAIGRGSPPAFGCDTKSRE